MNNFKLRALALTAGLTFASLLRAEAALVGNAGLKDQALDADTVKAVLLGKKVTLGDVRVVIIVAKAGDAQEQFLQQAVGMTSLQFQNHWRRLFMTGGGTAPKVVENDAEAIKLAAETPGGVAIVDKAKAAGLAVLAGK